MVDGIGCSECGAFQAVNGVIVHNEPCRRTIMVKAEAVNHPSHYNSHPSGIECIDVIEHMPLNIGNAVKYLWRAGLKDAAPTDEDYAKAIWYIERERQRLKQKQ